MAEDDLASNIVISCIKQASEKGYSLNEIAEICKVSKSTVARYRKKLGFVDSPPGNDEPPKKAGSGGAGINEILRAINQDYAETIRMLGSKTHWFQEALLEIGWISMVMAFQYAKIDVKDLPNKVEEFKDADNFVSFVTQYLVAMVQSSKEGVEAILERDREISKLRDAVKILAAMVKGLKKLNNDLTKQNEIMSNILSNRGLMEEYIEALNQKALLEAITQMSQSTSVPAEVGTANLMEKGKEGESNVQ
jgi:DNA-binding transcriptional regulator GbsR (MarR family)